MSQEVTPKKQKSIQSEMITQMLSLTTNGFGLVAALAWNNVVQEFVNSYIKKFLPFNSGIISLFIYAVLVTILAVVITYNLSQIKEKLEQ